MTLEVRNRVAVDRDELGNAVQVTVWLYDDWQEAIYAASEPVGPFEHLDEALARLEAATLLYLARRGLQPHLW